MKRNYIIVLFVLIFIFLELMIFLLPSFMENNDISKLKKEVTMVNDYISKDKGDINKINNYINSDVASQKRKKLEIAIDNYLKDLLSYYGDIKKFNDIDLSNIVKTDFSKDDLQSKIEFYNNYKDVLNNVKNMLMDINVDNYLDSNEKDLIDIFKDLLKPIDLNSYINRININVSNVDDRLVIFNFLNENKNYYNIEDSIIFLKRNSYNNFNTLLNDVDVGIKYDIVEDKNGPIINANNIVIKEGDYLSVSEKVSCIDDVDDNVACDISGSYNNNIVGTYTITVKAKDSSNNESSKNINIIVKEKEKYNLPYIIEVIRNQSVTIVYGQDDNGDYTRIVGVFPCSPGAGNNTPVGTFYSRRGYPWGGLFGGVYGQYSTIITGHVLFHSVPYHSMNKDDLVWEYYNRLGSKDSLGCVRLTVRDAKWIYDNCPSGTMIKIYDGELPNGVSKPYAQKLDPNDPRKGWDPTDPDPSNPWNQ